MKKLLIFDLDGTLLNTIADLAQSTNHALEKNGFPPHETDEYRFFVGNGINKLFERALPQEARTEENIGLIRKDFLAFYDRHNTDYSRPYPGIPQLLRTLQGKGFRLAVASNKYQAATGKLIRHSVRLVHKGLNRSHCVIGAESREVHRGKTCLQHFGRRLFRQFRGDLSERGGHALRSGAESVFYKIVHIILLYVWFSY